MIVRFDKNGLTLNGTLLTANDFPDPTPYNAVLSSLLAQNVFAIGSVEGDTRSNATYNYIRVGVDK